MFDFLIFIRKFLDVERFCDLKLNTVLKELNLETKDEISIEEIFKSGLGEICAEKMIDYCI